MEHVQVEDVEPSHDRPVEEDGAHALDWSQLSDQADHATRAIGPIDPHAPDTDRFHVLGERQRHGREGSVPVPTIERPVVDPHDAGMGLPEGAP
jgi:hypothetical protein